MNVVIGFGYQCKFASGLSLVAVIGDSFARHFFLATVVRDVTT